MRKMITFYVLICLFLGVNTKLILAQEAPSAGLNKAVEELLMLLEVDKQSSKIFDQIQEMQNKQLEAYSAGQNAEDVEKAKVLQGKMMNIVKEEMGWDKIKDDYIKVYTETFSEDEVKGLIEFYKSSIGQSMIKKTPIVSEKIMEITQKRNADMYPKIQQLMIEQQELQQKEKAAESAPVEAPKQ